MRRRLSENLKRVKERIQAACERSRRSAESVRLVAVTKTVEIDIIRAAIESGLSDIGENRVQPLVKRASMIEEHLRRRRAIDSVTVPQNPSWHMIGHLQRNKIRKLLPWVDVIHSVDSLRLAEEISAEASKIGKTVKGMIEVNVSGEKSKFGVAVGAVQHLAQHIVDLPGLEIIGLMTMAPFVDDPEDARGHFRRLQEVAADMKTEGVVGPAFRELSMGMTNDFEIAIEEGATMIRIGRALFEGLTPAETTN